MLFRTAKLHVFLLATLTIQALALPGTLFSREESTSRQSMEDILMTKIKPTNSFIMVSNPNSKTNCSEFLANNSPPRVAPSSLKPIKSMFTSDHPCQIKPIDPTIPPSSLYKDPSKPDSSFLAYISCTTEMESPFSPGALQIAYQLDFLGTKLNRWCYDLKPYDRMCTAMWQSLGVEVWYCKDNAKFGSGWGHRCNVQGWATYMVWDQCRYNWRQSGEAVMSERVEGMVVIGEPSPRGWVLVQPQGKCCCCK
ncbi:hypothetical protein BJ508DRAFT_348212 [Ascobolus immersus RN42]|uniref:Uncharacterized protein n=1 Tax=Ascobolus immersus RN42 TaxID=1160509 RepID=A0A3N4ICL3_ASCIM|nr:hypothetical protein BJ508DRAFT_348212 [Ascobolus immersus RN42]